MNTEAPSVPVNRGPGSVFDGTWLYDSQEEAKQACAAGCVAANELADTFPDGDRPRCAYAELYYSDMGMVYASCNLKTDACGDYS